MAQKSSDQMWMEYEDEFRAWLNAEIEMLEFKLRELSEIRDSMNEEDNHD